MRAAPVARASARWMVFPIPPRTATWSKASPPLPAARPSRSWSPIAMPSPSSACALPGPSAWAKPICRRWPTAACSAAFMAARKARITLTTSPRPSPRAPPTVPVPPPPPAFAAFGLAEETWSSGRGPASNNGLCAYTPSRGVISVRGNWPLTPTMDVVVPYARTMADLLAVLEVVVAEDAGHAWRPMAHCSHGCPSPASAACAQLSYAELAAEP